MAPTNTQEIGDRGEMLWDALCSRGGLDNRHIGTAKGYLAKSPDRLLTVDGEHSTVEIKAISTNPEWDRHLRETERKSGVLRYASGLPDVGYRICWQLRKSGQQHASYAERSGKVLPTITVLVDLRPASERADHLDGIMRSILIDNDPPDRHHWRSEILAGISLVVVLDAEHGGTIFRNPHSGHDHPIAPQKVIKALEGLCQI